MFIVLFQYFIFTIAYETVTIPSSYVAPSLVNGTLPRFAYTFYATNDRYYCSALVNAKRLRDVGSDNRIDILIFHSSVYSPSLHLKNKANILNIKDRIVNDMPLTADGYYRDCLVKLRVFDLNEYNRVILMDSDSIVIKPLDHLFLLPDVILAAPRAGWLPQPFLTSMLLVVKPDLKTTDRIISKWMPNGVPTSGYYDMDILNAEFAHEVMFLPDTYGSLNGIWSQEPYVNDTRTKLLQDDTFLVHFSDLGKPWSYTPEQIRHHRPTSHPGYYTLFELWRHTSEHVC
jgi:alpha-N-acetylglucosamine transferase